MGFAPEDIEESLIDSFRVLTNLDKARALTFIWTMMGGEEPFDDLLPIIDAAYPRYSKGGRGR